MIAANKYAGSTNGRIKIFNHPERFPINRNALMNVKIAKNPMTTVSISIIFKSRKIDR